MPAKPNRKYCNPYKYKNMFLEVMKPRNLIKNKHKQEDNSTWRNINHKHKNIREQILLVT